ncbi:innexin inx2 [Procambarus clarkii]|uniref:innexin inx2 n=1 Tax=Procambarus clarkii TaxID=6728 RepID=UPI0037425728
MFDVFGTIRQLLKLDKVKIDNVIFSLHYKVTMVILVSFSLLVTNKQYFGDPIDCMVDALDSHTIDMFCWIQSTFTIPSLTGAVVGEEVAHPGVANRKASTLNDHHHDGEEFAVRHHKYYQWVVLFLFLQAGMFYVPRYMWKSWEGGRVRGLVGELCLPISSPDLRKERINMAVNYFDKNLHHHNLYAYQFFVCELLNFVNVVGQFYFTDRFLDFGFTKYGPRVLDYSQDSSSGHDPMDEIFPKVAKCTFHRFGPSGTIMRHDALCVLPLNILNQKIFVFLWFWFVVVAVISAFGLLYRLATFLPGFRHLLLRGRSRLASAEKVEAISTKCHIGDWFILYLVARNMDPYVFKEFIN